MWIAVAIVVAAMVVVGAVVVALAGGRDRQASASGSPSSGSQTSSSSQPAGDLPAEIGGVPRLSDQDAAAIGSVMNSVTGGKGVEALGVYGEDGLPDFIYVVLDVPYPESGFDYRSFLKLSASGARATISGIVSGSTGTTKVMCAGLKGYPVIQAMCVVDTGQKLGMVISYTHPSSRGLVDDLLAAVPS